MAKSKNDRFLSAVRLADEAGTEVLDDMFGNLWESEWDEINQRFEVA
jgi:hypothetical protein